MLLVTVQYLQYSFGSISFVFLDGADKSFYGDSSFVYLSQSAMQLCHLEIGEQVVLKVNSIDSAIRTVWPTTERTLTSVILSPNDMG